MQTSSFLLKCTNYKPYQFLIYHFPVDRCWQSNINYFQLQPTIQQDSRNSLQSTRRIGFQNEKGNDKKKNKTGFVVISGILLIACIAGVLAWFLAKKGEDCLKCVVFKKIFSECFFSVLFCFFYNLIFHLQEMMNFLSNTVSFM